MPPAARVTDMHTCPMVSPGGVPHVGGPILPACSTNVMIGGLPAARVTDKCTCVGPPDTIIKGSATVLINNLPAARIGDATTHGGVIVMGCFNVLIGDGGGGGGGGPGGGGGGSGQASGELHPLSPLASGGAMSAPARQARTLKKAAQKGVPFVEPCDGPDPGPDTPPAPPPPPVEECCPDCAVFGQLPERERYFGFDDRTNLVPDTGAAYWSPPEKAKSAPGDRQTRDGANWLSVASGDLTVCTIGFSGSAPCIPNCTFVVEPAHVATVVSSTVAGSGVEFLIRGDAPGDCTVRAVCGGKDLGWVHVACRAQTVFNVGLCPVNQWVDGPSGQPRLLLEAPQIDLAVYQELFDDAWADAAVRVNLRLLPTHFVPADVDLLTPGVLPDDPDDEDSVDAAFDRNFDIFLPVSDRIHETLPRGHAVMRPEAGSGRVRINHFLYFLRGPAAPADPAAGAGISALQGLIDDGLNGFARNIPAPFALVMNAGGDPGAPSTAAHEFGHMIGLRHPNDPSGADQYPQHMRDALDGNVITTDRLNLMGYGGPRPQRRRLRYRQWDAVSGRTRP